MYESEQESVVDTVVAIEEVFTQPSFETEAKEVPAEPVVETGTADESLAITIIEDEPVRQFTAESS